MGKLVSGYADLVRLETADGELTFEIISEIEYEGKRYAIAHPADEDPSSDEINIVVAEMTGTADDERFSLVNDQILAETVFYEYDAMLDELYEGEEESP
ncbi:MAG: DUF1292 domain-containing protein [Christensenellaceae bacterium]